MAHAADADPTETRSDWPQWLGAFGLTWLAGTVAGSIVFVATGSVAADDDPSIPVLGASLVAGWVVQVVIVIALVRRLGSGDVRADLGALAEPVDLVGIPIGVAAQLALVPLVYLPLRAIWPATFDDDALSETAKNLVDRADGAMLIVLAMLVVIGAPIVEELVYRGMLQRGLLASLPPAAVVVGVAALFALIHLRPVEYPGLFVAGLVFGVCSWRTGRLATAVAAHVGFNAIGLGLAL